MNYQEHGNNDQYPNGFNAGNNEMQLTFYRNGKPLYSYMNQMPQLNPQAYEQAISLRQQIIQQQREYFKKLIKERYPVKFAIVISIILIVICLIEIVMQIMVIVNEAPMFFVGAGIWAGLFGIAVAAVNLFTAFKLNLTLFRVSQMVSGCGSMILCMGFCMITIMALSSYESSCSSESCSEQNTSGLPFHIVMISLGVIAVFLVWFMLIYITCKVNLRYAIGSQPRAPYHQSNNFQHVNQQPNGFQMNQMNGMNNQMSSV